ncbi:hypothetical protein RSC2_03708 [Bacillus paralicheniformis]|nr:hypothetical protein RSC1_01853 [Bacillus paralicheniformis]BCE11912.1 hypothetical protein RSC2_03708 [Bacillus paralicheniformis]BCE13525.1 hypothetical protein RSC3_00881 [Bacillus paralicheniformis]
MSKIYLAILRQEQWYIIRYIRRGVLKLLKDRITNLVDNKRSNF